MQPTGNEFFKKIIASDAKAPKDTTPAKAVSIRFVIGVIIVSMAVLVGSIWKSAMTFQPIDPFSTIKPLTPQKIADFGGAHETVKTSLSIDTFQKFDVRLGEFIFDGIISFEFNPNVVTLSTIEGFGFEKGEVVRRSRPDILIAGKNIVASYAITVKFTPDLDYSFFPLDDHQIPLVLINRLASPGDLVFDASESDFNIGHDLTKSGWVKILKTTSSGYIESNIDHGLQKKYHPAVLFIIGYGRAGIRHLINVVAPLMLLFCLTLFSFVFDPKKDMGTVLAVTLSTIGALIGFRFVIDTSAPTVSYFLMSDYLFLITFLAVFVIFTGNIAAKIVPKWVLYLFIVVVSAAVIVGYHHYLLVWLS